MPSWKAARSLAALLFLAAAISAFNVPSARADGADNQKEAAAAYDRGARAFGQGSYAVAATEFARADELAPAPAALLAALKAAILAEDPVLAMTLVDRAKARPADEGVTAQVARAKDRFTQKVGRLTLQCDGDCTAKVGNEPVTVGAARYYLAGNYVIEITTSGGSELFAVQIQGGSTMEWRPPSKEPPPEVSADPTLDPPPTTAPPVFTNPPEGPRASRLSPAWFAIGAGVTAISAGFTIGFGIDTLAQHDAFLKSPTNARSASGQDAQLRTNIFVCATAATAILTAVLGYFTFRSPSKSAAISPSSNRSIAFRPGLSMASEAPQPGSFR